jgi:hypothetical protein
MLLQSITFLIKEFVEACNTDTKWVSRHLERSPTLSVWKLLYRDGVSEALEGSSSFLDQDGLEHRSPLSSDTLMNNGSSGDIIMAGLMYNFLSPSFPVSFALSSDFFALSPPSNSWR